MFDSQGGVAGRIDWWWHGKAKGKAAAERRTVTLQRNSNLNRVTVSWAATQLLSSQPPLLLHCGFSCRALLLLLRILRGLIHRWLFTPVAATLVITLSQAAQARAN